MQPIDLLLQRAGGKLLPLCLTRRDVTRLTGLSHSYMCARDRAGTGPGGRLRLGPKGTVHYLTEDFLIWLLGHKEQSTPLAPVRLNEAESTRADQLGA
jgi:hypothetical protein